MKTLTNLLLATTIMLGACTQVSTGNDDNGGKTDPQLNHKSRIDLGQTVKSSILGKEVRYTIYLRPAMMIRERYIRSSTSFTAMISMAGTRKVILPG